MHATSNPMEKNRTNEGKPGGTALDRVPLEEMAAYSAAVKSLTNYEVLKSVESALLALVPGPEGESANWWNLRILLDELKWRLSGLEGAGTSTNRIPVKIQSK